MHEKVESTDQYRIKTKKPSFLFISVPVLDFFRHTAKVKRSRSRRKGKMFPFISCKIAFRKIPGWNVGWRACMDANHNGDWKRNIWFKQRYSRSSFGPNQATPCKSKISNEQKVSSGIDEKLYDKTIYIPRSHLQRLSIEIIGLFQRFASTVHHCNLLNFTFF